MSDTVVITGDQAEVKKETGGLRDGVVYTFINYYYPEPRINGPGPFAVEQITLEEGKGEFHEGVGGDTILTNGTTQVFIPKGWVRRDIVTGRYSLADRRLLPPGNVVPFPSAPRE